MQGDIFLTLLPIKLTYLSILHLSIPVGMRRGVSQSPLISIGAFHSLKLF